MKMLFSLILFSILGMPLYSGQHAKYEQWNQQGLSEGYHGHVEERIEEPYKHIQLLGINDFHGRLNVTRLVNDRPAGRADYLAAIYVSVPLKMKIPFASCWGHDWSQPAGICASEG